MTINEAITKANSVSQFGSNVEVWQEKNESVHGGGNYFIVNTSVVRVENDPSMKYIGIAIEGRFTYERR